MPVDVEARVLSNVKLSRDYNVVTLEAPSIAADTKPGQFLMVKPWSCPDPLLRRPFSIFQVLRDATGTPTGVSLLNKQIGIGTKLLYRAKPDDRLACLGPLGRPFSLVDPPTLAWMVAGGVGLAPFVTLAEALRDRGTPMTLFYGGRSSTDLYHVDTFEQLGVRVVLTTEDGSRGERGVVTDPLRRAFEGSDPLPPLMIYACGPTGMMQAVASLAMTHHHSSEVSLEPVMGCGLGGCYSCVVRVRDDNGQSHFVRSCLNGPVFCGERLVWEDLCT